MMRGRVSGSHENTRHCPDYSLMFSVKMPVCAHGCPSLRMGVSSLVKAHQGDGMTRSGAGSSSWTTKLSKAVFFMVVSSRGTYPVSVFTQNLS